MSDLKVFRMDDCDWWVGASAEECIKDREETYGPDEDFDRNEVYELSQKQLDELFFTDDMDAKRSFKEQLEIEIDVGGDFPRQFATTEF